MHVGIIIIICPLVHVGGVVMCVYIHVIGTWDGNVSSVTVCIYGKVWWWCVGVNVGRWGDGEML